MTAIGTQRGPSPTLAASRRTARGRAGGAPRGQKPHAATLPRPLRAPGLRPRARIPREAGTKLPATWPGATRKQCGPIHPSGGGRRPRRACWLPPTPARPGHGNPGPRPGPPAVCVCVLCRFPCSATKPKLLLMPPWLSCHHNRCEHRWAVAAPRSPEPNDSSRNGYGMAVLGA